MGKSKHTGAGSIIIIAPGIVLLFFLGSIVKAGGWENWKLQNFSKLSYLTVGNNPLLRGQDADINEAKKTEYPAERINLDELLSGGPPKDGIPSVDSPQFTSSDNSEFGADETILGVFINGEAKAYPYGILNWHEIVNDTVGDIPVSVTLCPLCDTGLTFDRTINGTITTFGVSGKLFQSCLVLYDRLTDTLYSQPWGIGVLGQEVNTTLKRYPTVKTTLGNWARVHPDTFVMTTDTGYNRDYHRSPYGTYDTDERLIFPARNEDRRLGHPKQIETYYYEPDGSLPYNQFGGPSVRFVNDEIKETGSVTALSGTRTVTAKWDDQLGTVVLYDEEGTVLPSSTAYGFVYPAFFNSLNHDSVSL